MRQFPVHFNGALHHYFRITRFAITRIPYNTEHIYRVKWESTKFYNILSLQEQLKEAVRQIKDVIKKPFLAIKEAIKKVIKVVKEIVAKIKEIFLTIKKIVLAIGITENVIIFQILSRWFSLQQGSSNRRLSFWRKSSIFVVKNWVLLSNGVFEYSMIPYWIVKPNLDHYLVGYAP